MKIIVYPQKVSIILLVYVWFYFWSSQNWF